jgi:dihydroorotase
MHLGLSLEEVIEKATFSAAKAIHREKQLGHLKIGTVADVAVFEVLEGEFEFFDTHRTKFIGNTKLKAALTMRGGKV